GIDRRGDALELASLFHKLEPIAQIPPRHRDAVVSAVDGGALLENQLFHIRISRCCRQGDGWTLAQTAVNETAMFATLGASGGGGARGPCSLDGIFNRRSPAKAFVDGRGAGLSRSLVPPRSKAVEPEAPGRLSGPQRVCDSLRVARWAPMISAGRGHT